MNCDEWFEKLYQILDADLSNKAVWKDLQDHMKGCQPCWDRFEFEKTHQSPPQRFLRQRILLRNHPRAHQGPLQKVR